MPRPCAQHFLKTAPNLATEIHHQWSCWIMVMSDDEVVRGIHIRGISFRSLTAVGLGGICNWVRHPSMDQTSGHNGHNMNNSTIVAIFGPISQLKKLSISGVRFNLKWNFHLRAVETPRSPTWQRHHCVQVMSKHAKPSGAWRHPNGVPLMAHKLEINSSNVWISKFRTRFQTSLGSNNDWISGIQQFHVCFTMCCWEPRSTKRPWRASLSGYTGTTGVGGWQWQTQLYHGR